MKTPTDPLSVPSHISSFSADDLRQQFEIQHATNYATAIDQVNAAFALVDGEFQIQENVEYELDENFRGVNGC